MAKDAKGHGSEKGHAEHWADSQRYSKQSTELRKAGKDREATDMRAKANESASLAKHHLIQSKRVASGQTMKQRVASGSAPKINKSRGDTFAPRKGKK